MKAMIHLGGRALLLMYAVGMLSACVNVKPWQRQRLADYTMQPGRDPLSEVMLDHVWFTREAFAGGGGIGGGGCGCN